MTPDTLSLIQSVAGHADGGRAPAPVHLWNPENCGEMDLVIRADGVWMHEGSPIGRPQLVRLLATVLRKDPDGYYLVTPVEKLKITVEDVPFRAVRVDREGDDLIFTTDMGERVTAGADHPVRVETDPGTGEPTPYVHVRGDLDPDAGRRRGVRRPDEEPRGHGGLHGLQPEAGARLRQNHLIFP